MVGDIVELAERYCVEGADELVFYDITASPDGRTVDRGWVDRVASVIDIPFCVAGGIRSVADAEDVAQIAEATPNARGPRYVEAWLRYEGYQYLIDNPKIATAFFEQELPE